MSENTIPFPADESLQGSTTIQALESEKEVKRLKEALKLAKEEAAEAHQEVMQAKEHAESLAQFPLNNPNPLMKIDVDKRKLIFVNPAGYNQYSDILTLGVEHPLLQGTVDMAKEAMRSKKPVQREITVGSVTYDQTVASNVMHDENRATVYCYDISRLKEIEERLREERSRAEQASKAKGDFLANMSHELRTPMNGVLGMAGLLKDTALSEEQCDLVETIRTSGESLLVLLNDILDFSKIEAGELHLENTAFDLYHVMKSTMILLEPLAQEKGLRLDYSMNPTCARYIVGDSARIRQVITNLLSNAVKFTSDGYVRLDVTSRRIDGGDVEIHFRVDDTGIGIAEDNLDKIFGKFTQADESTTRRFGGTGLGLAICQHIATLMGGNIGVESVEGQGSSFWVNVPVALASAADIRALHQEDQRKGRGEFAHVEHDYDFSDKRVIVIDDHPINLLFAKKLLKKFDFFTVDTANGGKEALQMVQENGYDVIITDCQMPEMDGYELTSKIRAYEAGLDVPKKTPIVAMTANALLGDKEKCLNAGMDDYVSKPINEKRLKDVLVKWAKPKDKAVHQVEDAGEDSSAILMSTEAMYQDTQKSEGVETAAVSAGPVDMEHLRLFTDGDVEEERELFGMYLETSQVALQEIKEAFASNDAETWRSVCHKLKGSSSNFGAQPMAEICAKAEKGKDAEANQKQAWLEDIEAGLEEVRGFFGEHY